MLIPLALIIAEPIPGPDGPPPYVYFALGLLYATTLMLLAWLILMDWTGRTLVPCDTCGARNSINRATCWQCAGEADPLAPESQQ